MMPFIAAPPDKQVLDSGDVVCVIGSAPKDALPSALSFRLGNVYLYDEVCYWHVRREVLVARPFRSKAPVSVLQTPHPSP